MKSSLTFAGLVLCLLPSVVLATPAHKAPLVKKAVAVTYRCSQCHMIYSAAQAKKNHYKDPMDGGTLVPVIAKKTTAKG